MLRESSGGWNSDGTTTITDLDAFIDGDLGVGVSPALDKIHLKENGAAVRIEDDSGNYATIRIGNSQLVISVDPNNAVGSTDLVFELDGVEVGRFFVGGNFGLGISAPAAKLHVFNLSANPAIMERASSSTTSVLRCLELHRSVDGGVGADGIGASFAFRVEDDGGSIESAAVISGVLVDADAAGEEGALVIELASDSGLFEAARFLGLTGDVVRIGVKTVSPDTMLHLADSTGITIGDGTDADQDLITVKVTGTPKLWWDEANDSFEMNKSLTLPGGSLKIGGITLSHVGTALAAPDLRANGAGEVAGHIKLKQGTTPAAHKEAGCSILWADGSDKLYLEKPDGTDVEVTNQPGTYTDADAIAAVEGEATLQFQQPTVISTKSGAGVLTLESVGNSLILQAGIDIRVKDDVLLFDNKKFWIGTSKDYWFEYNTSGSRVRFWTKNGDGAGTDMVWMRILDGTINPQFAGIIEVDAVDEFTAAAGVTIDGVLLKDNLVNGRNVGVDGTKLDGIESSATADQTGAEIKAAYEVEANAYTDTKDTKLAGIATGAEVSTKEIFVPAGSIILAANASYQTDHVTLPDGVSVASCWCTMRIPNDFTSLISGYPRVIFTQGTGGTGNFRISFVAYATAVGEQVGDTTDSIAEFTRAAPGASAELWEEDISAAFNGLALNAGDYISLRIDRDSDDVLDTFAGDLDVMGVVIRYT